jgi:hypothetical protein
VDELARLLEVISDNLAELVEEVALLRKVASLGVEIQLRRTPPGFAPNEAWRDEAIKLVRRPRDDEPRGG